MSLLIDDLKEEREEVIAEIDLRERALEGLHEELSEWRRALADFDRAIAALEPAPADEQSELFEDEQEAASEQLASDHALPFAADDVVIEIEASNQSESCVSSLGAETGLQPSPGGVEESPDQFEESPALNEAMQDEREQPVEDGYAPVTNPEADQVVSAMSWYSPKEIAERNKFDAFGLFKREKEEA